MQEENKTPRALSNGNTSFPIFLKVRDVVKKVHWKSDENATLETINELFVEKFETIRYQTPYAKRATSLKDRKELSQQLITSTPPQLQIYIASSDSDLQVTKNLVRNVTDLYPNCLIEAIIPKLDLFEKKDFGLSTYAFQKQKLAFVMVGLPARGKSYVARKIARYLRWIGLETQVFNVGNYRRERLGAKQSHEFFDPSNKEGTRARLHMAIAALDDMLNFLNKDGAAAIYDATNSTRERRNMILKRCTQENIQVVFVESICTDPNIIESNIKDTKLSMPDYADKNSETALQDFRKRIEQYEKEYQPLDSNDSHLSYCKLIDVGSQVIINNIYNYIPSRVIHFLMNLHITPRPIWFSRHGQSEYNVEDRVGGDSLLTAKGEEYAHALADWVETNITDQSLTVWTSTLKRAIGTAQYINYPKVSLRALDEIDAGICNGLTYAEIKSLMPEEYAARNANKLKYKYPQGESYIDVMQRLEPVLFELERQKTPVLIVSHQAVLRCLFMYFYDINIDELPYINVETHTIYQFTSRAYGTDVKKSKLM